MSINDPLGDMLTRIRNAQMRRKTNVSTPTSKLREHVLDVLADEGYIRGYARVDYDGGKSEFEIELKYFDGELKEIPEIPQVLKDKYMTAFVIDYKWLIDAAARRQKWIDQSQSVNLFLAVPDMKALSHMYRHAWHTGLKTTYYLRTLQASDVESSTGKVDKAIRGVMSGGARPRRSSLPRRRRTPAPSTP